MGDCQTDDPPFPLSRLVSKHTHSVRRSPNWGRKKSLILGMCSGPPRNYNQINRQAGCPQRLPPSQSGPAFLLLLATVLGAMDRDSFVLLILPLGLLVLEPVLVLLAVGHGGAFGPSHSIVSSTCCAFGRNSSNLFSAEAAETSIITVSPLTSKMMKRSL